MTQSGCIIVDTGGNMLIVMDSQTRVKRLAVDLKVKRSSGVQNPELVKYWGVYKISASPSSLPSCLASFHISSSPFPPRPPLPIICQKLCRFFSLKTRRSQNLRIACPPTRLLPPQLPKNGWPQLHSETQRVSRSAPPLWCTIVKVDLTAVCWATVDGTRQGVVLVSILCLVFIHECIYDTHVLFSSPVCVRDIDINCVG